MPQIVIIDGEEREVFTQEELEEQKNQALEDYKTNNPDKSEEVTKLQDELKKAQEDLKGLKDKDINFANLRNKVGEKEKEIEELKTSIDEKIGVVKKEILEGVMKDHYNDTLKSLVGEDKELLEKVEFQYKRLADASSTKEEISKKLNDAFILATGGVKNSVNPQVFSSGGVGGKPGVAKKPKLNAEEMELAMKLAQAGGIKLTEKDFDK